MAGHHHIHILGQPGVGKSVLLRNIYAKQIVSKEGLILIDLKADLKIREDFRALCSGAHRMNDFMIIDLSHPENSYGYNPLLFGNATELKDKLVGAFEWSEPYYKKISERVLLTLLLGLVWLRDNGKSVPTLDDLSAALASASNMVTLSELIENTTIKDSIRELASGFTKDFYQDLESLRTELTLLTKSEFGIIFTKPDP
ncbi:MAG TPA: hypothetical protein PLU50_12150, partial [Pseudobdellovibrionaceae bacterium]|nr:hypothetical protein [Pseudobdellovibrionaceae bacterium]